MKCTVDHILQEFNTLFLTRFRTYKIASPPQTKMTSKDDIKGLMSLKFLRPWMQGLVVLSVLFCWIGSSPSVSSEFRVSIISGGMQGLLFWLPCSAGFVASPPVSSEFRLSMISGGMQGLVVLAALFCWIGSLSFCFIRVQGFHNFRRDAGLGSFGCPVLLYWWPLLLFHQSSGFP